MLLGDVVHMRVDLEEQSLSMGEGTASCEVLFLLYPTTPLIFAKGWLDTPDSLLGVRRHGDIRRRGERCPGANG